MVPTTAERLGAASRGALLEEITLSGRVSFEDGRSSSATLCRTRAGLWLVLDAIAGDEGVVDLLASDRTVRYVRNLLGDRLHVDDWRLGVPLGRGEQALRAIARVRVARSLGAGADGRGDAHSLRERGELDHPDGPWSWEGPFIDAIDAAARTWLLRWLDPDERLLAYATTEEPRAFEDSLLADASGTWRLVLTERRQVWLAMSPVGDLWVAGLPDGEALTLVRATVGRSQVRGGEHVARLALGDESRFAAIAQVPARSGGDRLRELARAHWVHGGSEAASDGGMRARAILRAVASDDPLAALTLALVVDPVLDPDAIGPFTEPVLDVLRELASVDDPALGRRLLEWWQGWSVSAALGEVVVEHLCEMGRGGLQLALPLHEHLRTVLLAELDGDDLLGAAVLDFVLAEHLLELGMGARALEVLDARREALPSEELQDLLPPTPERGGQQVRIELSELVARAHAQLGDRPVAALADLARLQPLVDERLDTMIAALETSNGDSRGLLARAKIVRGLLDVGGFSLDHPRPDDGDAGRDRARARALERDHLELLRHPAAREDGVLGKLQGALAKVAVPDCSQLKSYCERANLAKATALARAIADASVMLGLGGVEPFVSRGDKSVGLRAYEGSTSFMLIGGDHLDPDSHAFLDEPALRFAVTAELTHLRFKHSRVTGDEVWSGTLDLGLTGLGMLIAAAPILKGLKAPAKHLLDKVGAPAIDRWRKKLAKRESHTLASDNSQLIAAHRVMQLSADRAGLVACGDPSAAIRAMFAVQPGLASQWPLVVSHGLRASLTRETSDDARAKERLEDLAVRVAALLSFFLSDDYAELRAAGLD